MLEDNVVPDPRTAAPPAEEGGAAKQADQIGRQVHALKNSQSMRETTSGMG